MTDKTEIVYRFTPQFEGAFLRNVPQRDLTQADVDRMTGEQRRDAFSPHPGYGTPLYTAVEGGEQPKWYTDLFEKAKAEGRVIPPRLPKETQKQYEERIAAETAAHDAPGDVPADEDGDA